LKNNLIVHGFKMVARLGEDTLWAHESAKDKLDPEKMSSYAKKRKAFTIMTRNFECLY
jgi:hypothetical protein